MVFLRAILWDSSLKNCLFFHFYEKIRKGEEQFSGSKNFNRRCKNYGQNKRTGAKRIREIGQLAEVIYSDVDRKIMHTCYADTLVFQKVDSSTRRLAAIRFGGYPEQVRAISDAIYGGGSITARVESHEIILDTISKKYVRSLSHDGVYAESVLYSIDDEAKDWCDESAEERKEKEKKKMYIFCREGDTDSLFEEFDKKTSIPMIPEFKEYILEECIKRQILIPMEVLSRSIRFDAYVMEVSQNETEIEQVVNDGLASGRITIPNATNDDEIKKLKNVSEYLNKYGVLIASRVRELFKPLFDPTTESVCDRIKIINSNIKKNVGYSLYPAQLAVAEAVKRRLDKAKVSLIIAECGSGKTKIGTVALAAHQNGKKCLNVVLCPSHVTKKWAREIEETLPDTKAAVVKSLQDIDRVYEDYVQGNKSLYIILSKERARDGYMRRPAVIHSASRKGFICPTCYHVIEEEIKKDGSKYTIRANQFFFNKENTQNHKCPHCGAPLWTAINPNDMNIRHNNWIKLGEYGFIYRPLASWHLTGNNLKVMDRMEEIIQNPDKIIPTKGAVRRYPLASYIAERFHKIDGFIADELHLFKGDSGQGNAMETLIGCSRKVIGMTATLINGYSSGMFYLLYRVVPRLMRLDNKEFKNPSPFNKEYGVSEKLYEIFNPDKSGEYNANSRAVKFLVREKQVPGVSPLVYSRFLLDSAVFLSLSDIGKHLPDYEEIPVELSLSDAIKKGYDSISSAFISLMKSHETEDMKAQKKVMSKFMSLLSTYPDQPYGNDPIFYPGSEKPIVVPEELSSIDELHEKDTAVLDIVERKVKNGERVMIFANWVKIDTQTKLAKILTEKGYRVAVLEQRVPPEKREEWVNKRLEEGLDVLITNASLIETGLDLNAFTTLIYYNIGYNLFTFRQSSRRSWRINQTAPRIEVYLLYYKGVMQANAIKLMASKLAAATLVEGNFSEEGLAAMSDCQDMTSQLATTLMSGIKDDVEDISDMFKKMAVIKDEIIDAEDDSEYLITETDIKVKVVDISEMSVSEKLKRARQLVAMLTQKKEKTKVNIIPPQTDGFYQFSLFDEAC